MPFPIIGALGLGAGLLGAFGKAKAAKAQAEAQRKADEERFKREGAAWDVGQRQRVGRLNAVQGLLQRTQPFLRSGPRAAAGTGPDYTFDPEVLKVMQEQTPYPGSLPADPRAGGTWNAIGGGASSIADILLSALAKRSLEMPGQVPTPQTLPSSGLYFNEPNR